MTRQVVVLIHGIGEQKKDYSRTFRRAIQEQLQKDLNQLEPKLKPKSNPNVEFREVLWANITSGNQKALWKRVNQGQDLDKVKLRKFFISYIGDAIAYQKTKDESPVYKKIHSRIEKEIREATNNHQNGGIEFTFVAHSLGSVIVSNYLYDNSKRLTATNLFTLGSPIAVWLLRHGDLLKANKPVKVMPSHGIWINILDEDDVIAYPLRDINAAYKNAVALDYVTQIGGLFTSWNPLSHAEYWKDDNVIKPIARKLALDKARLQNGIAFQKKEYLNYIRNLWNI